jgi:hypothetical protein
MHSTTKGLWLLLAGLSVVATGCAYGYVESEVAEPEAAMDAQSGGPPVLQYGLPADHPKGKAYVISLGPENVPGPDKQPQALLHLRIAVENEADVEWTLDPGEMTVAFDGAAPVLATYARSSPRGRKLAVAAGQRGELDLFFPLPGGPERPARADLVWRVHRGTEAVTTSSRFDVLRGPNEADVYYQPVEEPGVVYLYGPGWWWGSYWGFGWWGSPWWWGGWYGPRYHGWHRGYGGYPGGYRGGYRGGAYGGGYRGGASGGSYRGGASDGSYRGGGFRGTPMGRGGIRR